MPKKYLTYFTNHPHQNEREKNQQGCYIRIIYNNLESVISDDPNSHTYFRKIYIKKNSHPECLNKLEQKYKISKLNLYSNSIEGAVKHCKTQIPSPYEYMGGPIVVFEQKVIDKN
ncbi:hypothetical protein [Legionella sainthelensi]|uniref:hypothetical protein n=1 Tax=Legionella sainthelensi TaxID=28087 RepID=UPI000E201BF2|nr:hypothetical protein [Legionella sainthelensi]